ncbi:MAG: type II toxin-antitoxin system VapC family toxin [Deltaproteobacteria bacterium]|nr:type II toxin-antitoxin system VapC family toxin [Deltaproteobacteria bacterium]
MQTKSQEKIVLDAWAVLALIFGEEPAASVVKDLFVNKDISRSSMHMSWINLGEVYYTLARRKGMDAADEVLKDIQMLPVTLHEPSKADVLSAAKIKAKHKLSYADAFAVSLAEKTNGTLFTGDPEIILLGDILRIRQLSKAH